MGFILRLWACFRTTSPLIIKMAKKQKRIKIITCPNCDTGIDITEVIKHEKNKFIKQVEKLVDQLEEK